MLSKAMKRRLGYTAAYECIAILCSTGLLVLFGNDIARSLPLSMISSVIAVVWNLVWNTLFEFLEKRFSLKGRPVGVRVAHAIGFEGGIAVMSIPVIAWMLNYTLLEAFLAEAGLLVFFLLYTYVFNFVFDKIFGLPESAKTA